MQGGLFVFGGEWSPWGCVVSVCFIYGVCRGLCCLCGMSGSCVCGEGMAYVCGVCKGSVCRVVGVRQWGSWLCLGCFLVPWCWCIFINGCGRPSSPSSR